MLSSNRGQQFSEYAVLVGVVATAFLSAQLYLSRRVATGLIFTSHRMLGTQQPQGNGSSWSRSFDQTRERGGPTAVPWFLGLPGVHTEIEASSTGHSESGFRLAEAFGPNMGRALFLEASSAESTTLQLCGEECERIVEFEEDEGTINAEIEESDAKGTTTKKNLKYKLMKLNMYRSQAGALLMLAMLDTDGDGAADVAFLGVSDALVAHGDLVNGIDGRLKLLDGQVEAWQDVLNQAEEGGGDLALTDEEKQILIEGVNGALRISIRTNSAVDQAIEADEELADQPGASMWDLPDATVRDVSAETDATCDRCSPSAERFIETLDPSTGGIITVDRQTIDKEDDRASYEDWLAVNKAQALYEKKLVEQGEAKQAAGSPDDLRKTIQEAIFHHEFMRGRGGLVRELLGDRSEQYWDARNETVGPGGDAFIDLRQDLGLLTGFLTFVADQHDVEFPHRREIDALAAEVEATLDGPTDGDLTDDHAKVHRAFDLLWQDAQAMQSELDPDVFKSLTAKINEHLQLENSEITNESSQLLDFVTQMEEAGLPILNREQIIESVARANQALPAAGVDLDPQQTLEQLEQAHQALDQAWTLLRINAGLITTQEELAVAWSGADRLGQEEGTSTASAEAASSLSDEDVLGRLLPALVENDQAINHIVTPEGQLIDITNAQIPADGLPDAILFADGTHQGIAWFGMSADTFDVASGTFDIDGILQSLSDTARTDGEQAGLSEADIAKTIQDTQSDYRPVLTDLNAIGRHGQTPQLAEVKDDGLTLEEVAAMGKHPTDFGGLTIWIRARPGAWSPEFTPIFEEDGVLSPQRFGTQGLPLNIRNPVTTTTNCATSRTC